MAVSGNFPRLFLCPPLLIKPGPNILRPGPLREKENSSMLPLLLRKANSSEFRKWFVETKGSSLLWGVVVGVISSDDKRRFISPEA